MRVVDVGAHAGYHTIRFARLVGTKGKVFAFEPYPSTCDVLVRNIRRRGLQDVVVEQKAVGDTRGWVDLWLSNNNIRHGTVQVGNTSIKVEACSLDEYFQLTANHIYLAKVDVEGAELKVYVVCGR